MKILQLNTYACSHPSACCFWLHLLQDKGQCVKTMCRDSKLLVLSQGEKKPGMPNLFSAENHTAAFIYTFICNGEVLCMLIWIFVNM